MATKKRTMIHHSRKVKCFAVFMAVNILNQVIFPTVSWALTSGPSQEEFASFEPAGTSDMVDLYSGDFNYNLPLLSVPGPNGGYPINLAYHSGVGMDQEASWVGLGWNINVGAINRQLRGLPDDFKGDQVKQLFKLNPNITASFNIPKKYKENFGFPTKVSPLNSALSWQVYYNNYKGLGYRVTASLSREVAKNIASIGLKLSYDSQNGLGIEPDLTVGGKFRGVSSSFRVGASLTSRSGLQSFSFSSGLSAQQNKLGKKGNAGYDGTSSLSFATVPSVPWVNTPMKNVTTSFDLNLGLSSRFGKFSTGIIPKINGYVTSSAVDASNNVYAGYGYFNTNQASAGDLKDFQRNTIPYSDKVPNLSPSLFTYDLFMQSGQGTGSLIRPYLPGVNVLSDRDVSSSDVDRRFNVDVGIGSNIHIGLGYTQTNGSIRSGSWDGDNELSKDAVKSYSLSGKANYEPYYMQVYGEKSGFYPEDDQLSLWGNDAAVRMKVVRSDNKFVGKKEFIKLQSDGTPTTIASASNWDRKQRQRRATSVENFTANDVYNKLGYTKYTGYVNAGANVFTDVVKSGIQNSNHLSEISVLQPDGMRYVYGLPAYNNKQVDANFSVNAQGDFNTRTVPVPNNGTDITPGGRDGYLSQTELPAYVHSWMLTAVFSSDYFDVTGNGPSDDDYGYWVKFNYEKSASNYKWRVPYQEASFAEGNQNDPTDDKGTFSYGEKEMYYITSVETKTHIAVFNKTNRIDGVEASGIFAGNGQQGPQKSLKLDNIKLYAKKNYWVVANPNAAIRTYNVNASATPLKIIKFTYNNTLCAGVSNSVSGNGKLTLTKVEVLSGASNRGSLSPYVFTYGATNPNYDNRSIDRWGNYKNTSVSATNFSALYPYIDFPYTQQDDVQNVANWKPSAGEWSLTEIKLPTGGKLKIDYESDDYAYVETKKATHMYDIKGLASYNSAATKASASITTVATEVTTDGFYKVFFNLEKPIPIADVPSAYNYVKANYVGDATKAYFKIFADLKNGSKDYVSGYADINLSGSALSFGLVASGSNYVAGYISLLPVTLDKISGKDVSPFTKMALQHLRANRSELAHTPVPYSTDALAQVKNLVGSVFGIFDEISQTITGFNSWAFSKGYGQQIDLNGRSVICLQDADGKKYGGGSRVKRIAITDDTWSSKNAAGTAVLDSPEYGQEYDYTTKNADGNIISSGVAYEPQIGGEESALHAPVNYTNSTFLANADNLFVQTPLLENYYPGASVGYSKVTVRSISAKKAVAEIPGNALKNTAAPVTTYEFYTPKDFPVWFEQTDMNSDPMVKRPIIVPGIYSRFLNRKARSQGYSIVITDMAGKAKSIAQSTLPPTGEGSLISKKEYVYNTMDEYSAEKVNRLSSRVQVLADVSGDAAISYRTATVGQSHDIFIDMNENAQKTKGRGLDLNVDVKLPSGLPFMIMPIPYISDFQTSMRTAVTHKIIYRTGILKEVTERNYESVVKTENIAFNIETGEPLLTRVSNEFKDPVVNLSYPASWYYTGMGAANQNIGFEYKPSSAIAFVKETIAGSPSYNMYLPINITTAPFNTITNPASLFAKGDEWYAVLTESGVPLITKLILEDIKVSGNILKLYTCIPYKTYAKAPTDPASLTSLRIIRSGYRNMQSASAGQVVSVQKATNILAYNPLNPLTYKSAALPLNPVNLYDSVLNASAIRYTDILGGQLCYEGQLPGDPIGNTLVAYVKGERGRYRPVKEYTYISPRKNANPSPTDTDNDHVQQGGIFYNPNKVAGQKEFIPFNWKNTPALYTPAFKPWTLSREVTIFSPWGWELENRDAIGNFSAAIYGYDVSLPVAIAKNARNKELIYNDFESIGISGNLICNGYTDDYEHSIFAPVLSTKQHHTGIKSMLLAPSTTKASYTSVINATAYSSVDVGLNKFEYKQDLTNGNLLPTFKNYTDTRLAFIPNKEYYFSCWIKQTAAGDNGPNAQIKPFINASKVTVEVNKSDASAPDVISIPGDYKAASVDGWVKVEGKFKFTHPLANNFIVKFENISTDSDLYIDDIRIYPADASMKTFVYDPVNLKLTAELDENNYATFYNYDSDGNLVKIKKETIAGIKTIKEGRNLVKRN